MALLCGQRKMQVKNVGPGYSDHNSYWVGASDVTNEGDFRWTDSLPFSYTNWFPGWTQHGGYNRQPNDDGFSAQDCVELRRAFLLPPPNAAPAAQAAALLPLDSSFRWNDRDCSTRNHFLCERPRDAQCESSLLEPDDKNYFLQVVVVVRHIRRRGALLSG
ncbi:uncharacterized protein LOC127749981 [Frankliniella occidentalis]|uniref:Uncharacterized protein LOC127749981 n=1 Tax=Frankliniella occidentalis TaxID=133901 RepID=A0A9C6WY12_FRAOC|nr:uncharacterized protein LOC127749981 [Frankliniella occidentalis]